MRYVLAVRGVRDVLVRLYGPICLAATLLSGYLMIRGTQSDPADERSLLIYILGILGILLMLQGAFVTAYFARKRRYAQSLAVMNSAFASIRHLDIDVEGMAGAARRLRNFLDQAAKTFSVTTGTNCSCAIKILKDPGIELSQSAVVTLCRD
ncbi:MAG: hypothetical protein KTR15_02800 [Phycisphaeraceae bacterium]|nr:hypothetical protein [Phycisphaeraceae bacterium]